MEENKKVFILNPSTPEKWDEYYVFAHDFDGYAAYPDNLKRLAGEVMKGWYEAGELPDDLNLLRASLFQEARISRFITGYPGEEDMTYLDALVAKIKTLMSTSTAVIDNPQDIPTL